MLRLGRYRHYSGKEYSLVGIAKHSENHEDLVVYRPLYDNDVSQLWVRPLAMFIEEVEINGKKVPRFAYIGP